MTCPLPLLSGAADLQSLCQKLTITRIGEVMDGLCGFKPVSAVAGLCRVALAQRWARKIDGAQLFGPEVIFRHKGKTAKCAHASDQLHGPAGFLPHFAVQCGNGILAALNTATGQLKLGQGFGLMRQQHPPVPNEQGVSARTQAIRLVAMRGLVKATDHGGPWRCWLCAYIRA